MINIQYHNRDVSQYLGVIDTNLLMQLHNITSPLLTNHTEYIDQQSYQIKISQSIVTKQKYHKTIPFTIKITKTFVLFASSKSKEQIV